MAGGTSFDAPIFSGMLAIVNQKLNSTGQGVVNSTLYTLAADSTTYASAFHDITSGGNECSAGATYCSTAGESEFLATTGYDEASGLGSVDFYNLLTAWPTTTSSSLDASLTTLEAATTSPAAGAGDAITISVAASSSSVTTTPTGTLTVLLDGTTDTSSLALSSGSATYTFSSATTGSHVITATYSGDSTFAASTGTLTVTVGASTGTFTVAATNLTVSEGNSGTSTITITPTNGYTGTIGWTVSSSPSLSNGCYSVPDATVSSTSAVTAVLSVYTSASACASASVRRTSGKRRFFGAAAISSGTQVPPFFLSAVQASLIMAGLLFAGSFRCRSHAGRRLDGAVFMVAVGLMLAGCVVHHRRRVLQARRREPTP